MSYNVICDRCGFKYKNHELRKEWTGHMVCEECWEPRHPQDMVKARPDQRPLPYTRPEPTPVEVENPFDTSLLTDIPEGHFTENNSTE